MKDRVQTDSAPKAIGPYFASDQIERLRVRLRSNTAGSGNDADRRRRNTRANQESNGEPERSASSRGTSLERVVKTTVYLKDLTDFTEMNEVYGSFLPIFLRPLYGRGFSVAQRC